MDKLAKRSVVFVYPGIGGPGREDLLEEWTVIAGPRGRTSGACGFRDELAGFRAERVEVFGLSCQSRASQRAHVDQLPLPYLLLSDEQLH